MARQWYLQTNDAELGPLTFRELVDFVRAGTVSEASKVRPHLSQDWQRADTVVGLFYMARKSAAVPAVREPPASDETQEESPPIEAAHSETAPELEGRPNWMTRLWQLGSRAKPKDTPILGPASVPDTRHETDAYRSKPLPATQSVSAPAKVPSETKMHDCRADSTEESPSSSYSPDPASRVVRAKTDPGDGRESVPRGPELASDGPESPETESREGALAQVAWSATINAALERLDRRAKGEFRRGRFARILAKLPNLDQHPWLRVGFRVTCSLAAAAAMLLAIEMWSARQAIRTPPRGPQQSSMRHFPGLGRLGRGEYLFLITDLTIVSAAAAYLGAIWVGSRVGPREGN